EPRAGPDSDLDLALLNDDIANPIAVALPGIAPGLEQGCDPGCILTELRSELGEVRCEFGDGELVGVIEDADGFDVAFLGNEIRQRGDTLAGRGVCVDREQPGQWLTSADVGSRPDGPAQFGDLAGLVHGRKRLPVV